jgi:glycosyltransferase involved in cell wall biosynthesis
MPHRAYCFAQLTARRLMAEGYRGEPIVLPGIYGGVLAARNGDGFDPARVVYAGRHVREKRLDALVHAFAWARRRRPDLRLELYGDGPDRPRIQRIVRELGLSDVIEFAGRRSEQDVAAAFARAACVATASEREGYGLIVVEAAAHGTPSVVVSGPENAAIELVHEGVNGAIAPDAAAEHIGEALLRVIEGGTALRESTKRWFAETAETLRLDRSLALVLESYAA